MAASRALRFGLLALLSLSAGCTVFTDYGSETEDARVLFEAGKFKDACAAYSQELDATNDSLLYHLEAGTAAHCGKDYERSRALLDKAYEIVDAYLFQGLGEKIAQSVGSVVVNEKTQSYTGAVFEQLFLQAYQARNYYLLPERREGVLVEVLRTYDIQDKARQLYEKELSEAEKEAGQENSGGYVDVGQVQAELHKAYDYGDLSRADDVYDPTFIRYLNAWLREAVATNKSDLNDAWVDLKYVADRYPQVEFVIRDWIRLARASGAGGEAREMERKYGIKAPGKDEGSVAVFFECGMAPALREVKVIFPTYKGAAAVAVPVYEPTPNPAHHAELLIGDQVVPTTILSDVNQIAFRYHSDRMPLIIARMVIRLIIKIGVQTGGTVAIEEATRGTKNEGVGELAALGWSALTSAWNVISEQADVRCWRTLPQTFQATRVFLPEGDYPARLRLIGAGGAPLGEVDLGTLRIAAKKHRLINARSIGTRLYCAAPAEPYDPKPEPPPVKVENVLDTGEAPAGDIPPGEDPLLPRAESTDLPGGE